MSGESPAVVLFDINGNALTGPAGTPATSVLTIQGIGGGTAVPVSGTVAVTQSTSPWVENISQFGGNNVVTGTGASGVGIPRVTVANDSNILATQSGTWTTTVTQATAANLNATVVGTTAAGSGASTGLVTVQGNASGTPIPVSGTFSNPSTGATAAAPPADATYIGGLVNTSTPSGYTNGDMYPFSLTTTGLLRVDGSNVTQPVSGTVSATQSGTWTVQPGNTANTTPWLATISQGGNSATVTASNALKVDGSGVTQPVSGTVTTNHSATGTITSVASATSSTTLLAANSSRVSATIYNNAVSGNLLYVALAGTANTTTSYTIKLWPGSYWDLPINYTGIITGIWVATGDHALVTELT